MIKLKNLIKSKIFFNIMADGKSMFPLFHSGDILYLKKISFGKLKTDDIVMVEKNKKRFVHRIIYKTKDFAITKGDNNLLSDGRVYPSQILGKVIKCKRKNRMFSPEDIYLVQSTLYFGEIIKIKNEFENGKIDYVILKGLPIHLYYEKTHPKRVYADCDLLLKKQNREKAEEILVKFGYQKIKNDLSRGHKFLRDKTTEVLYRKYLNGFPVFFDLHFEAAFLMTQLGSLNLLYPQKNIEKLTDDFLEEKRIIKIKGIDFPVLSLSNLILYLSLHFFHHNYTGIFRLKLLDKLIRTSSISPRVYKSSFSELYLKLGKKIIDFRLQNFVYLVFVYLRKYFLTPVPREFFRMIKPDKKTENYIDRLIKQTSIFSSENRFSAGISRFKNIFYLSPAPLYKKILIIFNPQVLYSLTWTIVKLLTNHSHYLIL